MNITELKLMALRERELYETWEFISVQPYADTCSTPHTCGVHLTARGFKEMSKGKEIVIRPFDDDRYEEYFVEDGVKFFALVDKEA